MDQEWGPWVEHDGRGLAVPVGTVFEGVFERRRGEFVKKIGVAGSGLALSWNWSWWLKPAPDDGNLVSRLIRYRIRKPRALLDLIELVTNPYTVPPQREVVPA